VTIARRRIRARGWRREVSGSNAQRGGHVDRQNSAPTTDDARLAAAAKEGVCHTRALRPSLAETWHLWAWRGRDGCSRVPSAAQDIKHECCVAEAGAIRNAYATCQ